MDYLKTGAINMMKSSTDSVKVTQKIKDYKMKDWLLLFQIMLAIITVGIFIYTYLIEKNYKYFTDISLSLLLFELAYNNKKIYKRKNFTIIYMVCGILFLLSGIGGIFNG